jgi:hypothetical protein
MFGSGREEIEAHGSIELERERERERERYHQESGYNYADSEVITCFRLSSYVPSFRFSINTHI